LRMESDCSLSSTQRIVLFGFILCFRNGEPGKPRAGGDPKTFLTEISERDES
jgi:hypothetical protein